MSNMVVFGNPGKINPKVWSVFGVSAKLGDNSIGRFGTGLKYAIAVLLREGREIRIRSGEDVYEFTTKLMTERGKDFHQVLCNGEEMPYTTHLGEGWELWQAYRELFSNCLDEGGQLGYVKSPDSTHIEAEIGDIDHNSVFLNTKGLTVQATSMNCEIYSGTSEWLYYRGVRAYKLDKPAKFTYNILNADLTEDRTFKYLFDVEASIGNTVLFSKNRDFAYEMFLQTKDYWEESIRFRYAQMSPSEIVIEVVNSSIRNNVWMHQMMKEKVSGFLPQKGYCKVEPCDREKLIIERATNFCEKIGYPVNYPVNISNNIGNGKLAVANRKDMEVYLSPRLMTMGLKQVVSTLIEENMHLEHGLNDCNYETQTWLFDQIVTMGEKLTGEIL